MASLNSIIGYASMLALVLTLAAFIFLVVAVIWFASQRPDYQHFRNTISELGEYGARSERIVSYGVFLPIGGVLLAVALLTKDAAPSGALLALCMAIGYVTSAFFPCDPGSPIRGSGRQFVHNYVGGIEYVGGSLVMWHLGWIEDSNYFRAAAIFVGIASVALMLPSLWHMRGLVQRATEVGLFAGLAAAVWLPLISISAYY